MKILIITGRLLPVRGHNANLMMKLLPFLRERCEVHLLSFSDGLEEKAALPKMYCGVPVHWAYRDRKRITDALIIPAIGKIVDHNGYSDYMTGMLLAEKADEIYKKFAFNSVLASTEPFTALVGMAHIKSKCKKYLYMMDPPEMTWGHPGTPYRNRSLSTLLNKIDCIFTTAYAKEALAQIGIGNVLIESIGFPMVEKHCLASTEEDLQMASEKINLLFCGTMSKALQRSPRYYLDFASRLDSRFCLYFMGRECDNIEQEFNFHTDAQVVALPPKPYQTALNAMHDTDILINIGNNVRVHVPSKIVEYISTGKPIVNFYKFDACPTLDYTSRYPLCLNVNEQEPITDKTVEQFIQFCISAKGKKVLFKEIEDTFFDWTPQFIADQILTTMMKNGNK